MGTPHKEAFKKVRHSPIWDCAVPFLNMAVSRLLQLPALKQAAQ